MGFKRMIGKVLLVCLSAGGMNGSAQPLLRWEKRIGGTDSGVKIRRTSGPGFAVVGMKDQLEGVWLARLNEDGDTLWSRSYRGSPFGCGNDIQETSDGGFIIAGYFSPMGDSSSTWLIKTDSSGNRIWDKAVRGDGSQSASSVRELRSGGFVVTGVATTRQFSSDPSEDAFLMKTDTAGNPVWWKAFGGPGRDRGTEVLETPDGDFVVFGWSGSGPDADPDFWLFKTDPSGETVWSRTFGGPKQDYAASVWPARDGGFLLAGTTESSGSNLYLQAWLGRTDASGNPLWQRSFGASGWNYGTSVQETPDGGILLYGRTQSNKAGEDSVWLMQTGPTGSPVWKSSVHASSFSSTSSANALRLQDGGFLLLGQNSDGLDWTWLIRLDPLELIVDFKASRTGGQVPCTVTFTDLTTFVRGGAVSRAWDLDGDGTADSSDPNPTWTYWDSGEYSVRLTVSSGSTIQTRFKGNHVQVEFPAKPVILRIEDVPDDQGGWVEMSFVRALEDDWGQAGYSRRYTVEWNAGSGWVAADTVLAVHQPSYTVRVPTPFDSTASSSGRLSFRVIFTKRDLSFIGESRPGFSADNLAPAVPAGVFAESIPSGGVRLQWKRSVESDFSHYRVLRFSVSGSDSVGFEAEVAVQDTFFTDHPDEGAGRLAYRISAVDRSGNESGASEPVFVTLETAPLTFALLQNHPNPFNGGTRIPFWLPEGGPVRISVYNAKGQRIRLLADGRFPKGRHFLDWNPGGLPSGVFVFRMEAGRFTGMKKGLLLR